MALLRIRMMDKDDLESFIRSTASADFLAEPEHATLKKPSMRSTKPSSPITSRSRLISRSSRITAWRPHRPGPVEVQLVRHQREKSRGMARRLALFCHLSPRSGRNTPRTSTSASTWTKITLIPCSLSQTRSTTIPWTATQLVRQAFLSVLAFARQSQCSTAVSRTRMESCGNNVLPGELPVRRIQSRCFVVDARPFKPIHACHKVHLKS